MDLGRELERLVAHSGSTPLLVWYGEGAGDRPGTRIELSAITVQNWIDKIIAWLDDLGLQPGEPIAAPLLVHHPAHWVSQLWAVAALVAGNPLVLAPGAPLSGSAVSGLPSPESTIAGSAATGLAMAGSAHNDAPLTITGPELRDLAALAELGWPVTEVIAASLHPLGMGFTEALPDGMIDLHEVLAQPDVHLLPPVPDADQVALVLADAKLTYADLALAAMTTRQVRPAQALGGPAVVTDGLAAAIHAGRTIVLAENGNPLPQIATAEHAELVAELVDWDRA